MAVNEMKADRTNCLLLIIPTLVSCLPFSLLLHLLLCDLFFVKMYGRGRLALGAQLLRMCMRQFVKASHHGRFHGRHWRFGLGQVLTWLLGVRHFLIERCGSMEVDC